jgi:hypothetical protein
VACNNERAASTNAEAYINTGRNLDGESGGVYLFNNLGQLVNFVEYGHQIEDRSIGRVGAQWRLTASPTPGVANSAQATLGVANTLVFNEWMAGSPDGEDWFELFQQRHVACRTERHVADGRSFAGRVARFKIAPLSFIAPRGFALFNADEDPGAGRNHVTFSLSAEGESLRLYGATSNLITAVYFGAQQPGVSQGRLPDGSLLLADFPGSPSTRRKQLPPPGQRDHQRSAHACFPHVRPGDRILQPVGCGGFDWRLVSQR